jgi:benzoyl-CoA reductase subunit C
MEKQILNGLARAKGICRDRARRVNELKAQGKKVMGYLCIYPPTEMMTALDLIPFRIFGNMREPVTVADKYLPSVVCPFLRSLLDVGLKGGYDLLDGITFVHTCDVGAQFSGNWKINIKTPFSHFIDMPHTTHEGALDYFKGLLKDWQTAMEEYFGNTITPENLKRAVRLHNDQRSLVRQLYELRKTDPPLISGAETLEVIISLMSLPVEEGNDLLMEVIDDVRRRTIDSMEKKTRLMIWGSIIDDTPMLALVESLDAHVVMDDTCVGSRAYFADVQETRDPLDGLARHYLTQIKCARTFTEAGFGEIRKNYLDDLSYRFGYLGEYIREYRVDGVILQSLRYCDGCGYDIPGIKDYLKGIGIPGIYIEHNYTESAFAPLRTRIQSFIEMLEA